MNATRSIRLGSHGTSDDEHAAHPSALARALRGLGRASARASASLRAAQVVARHADHYYAMSDAELARIGLTRDQLPAALLRELDSLQRR